MSYEPNPQITVPVNNRFYHPFDATDTALDVGDYFCYTTSAGRSAVMKWGKVVKFKPARAGEWEEKPCAIQAITVDQWPCEGLPQQRVDEITTDSSPWAENRRKEGILSDRFELQKKGGLTTIHMTARCLRIPSSLVPLAALSLIDEAASAL